MAVTVVGPSPSFDKEFNNVISISNYTNKVLVPNKDNVAVPTDSLGVGGDFSEAIVTFYVLDASEVVTTDWTISLSSSTDCTVSVSDATKKATVSAIDTDTANFVVKASKTGESDLFRLVTVYKAKAGVDGTSTPDNETIVIDGSSHLKVNNHTVYNDGADFIDTLLIGVGLLDTPGGGATNIPSNNNICIQTDSTATTGLGCCDNIITVGNNINMWHGLSTSYTVNTNGILIGNDLSTRVAFNVDNFADNFIVCGYTKNGIGYVTNNTISIGIDPTNKIEDTIALSYVKNSSYLSQGNNDRYITSTVGYVGTSSSVDFDLDISNLQLNIKGSARVIMNISGQDALGNVYSEEVYMVIENNTAVLDYSDANKKYSSGTMSTLTVTHSYVSGGTLRVNVTTTTERGTFVIHYDIIAWG